MLSPNDSSKEIQRMANNNETTPLLENERVPENAVQTVQQNMADMLRSRMLFAATWIELLETFAEIVVQVWVLAISWSEECDQPLRQWVIVRVALQLMLFVVNIVALYSGSYRQQSNEFLAPGTSNGIGPSPAEATGASVSSGAPEVPVPSPAPAFALASSTQSTPVQFCAAMKQPLQLGYFVSFLTGNVWLIRATKCLDTSPKLYLLCKTLILLGYLFMALPLILVVCLLTCLPIVIVIMAPIAALASALQRSAVRRRLASIPSLVFRRGSLPEDEAVCAICRGPYEDGEDLRKLPCRHMFHKTCIDRWLLIRPICPMCRGPIEGFENLPPV
mmetsp:Transcript_15357/g.25376  ORF Transcript_15357/g.25376 Transcript_15357/m.25376 type:complete len:333 (-) Transcript_15357:373-1371(-)